MAFGLHRVFVDDMGAGCSGAREARLEAVLAAERRELAVCRERANTDRASQMLLAHLLYHAQAMQQGHQQPQHPLPPLRRTILHPQRPALPLHAAAPRRALSRVPTRSHVPAAALPVSYTHLTLPTILRV